MWEAIRSNRRRSMVLVFLIGLILMGLGYAIGQVVDPVYGGLGGIGFACILWGILSWAAFTNGDRILLRSARAHEIQKEDYPRLWNIVEEMTIASGLGRMPRVYVIEDSSPNAFAVGRKPEDSAVAVTSGLLSRLNRDELQGVVAHEIGHIRNNDVRFMTFIAITVGCVELISYYFLRSFRFRGRSRGSRGGRSSGGDIAVIIALVAAVLAPILARLLYFACSRRREYLADASAVQFTRFPEGLASALSKISRRARARKDENRALAALYIVNPFQGVSFSGLFSTHPPTEKRIAVLRSMEGMAGLIDYENAFGKVMGGGKAVLGSRDVQADKSVPARAPTAEAVSGEGEAARVSEVHALLGRLGEFLQIQCLCGVGIKVPPDFPGDRVTCPRCGKVHDVPRAKRVSGPGEALPVTRYKRRGTGWDSFQCSCGKTIQLSPSFSAPFVRCRGCGNKIEITPVER